MLALRFEDVAAASKVEQSSPRTSVEMQTFDGLVATIDQYDYNDENYLKFSFAFDEKIVEQAPPEPSDDSASDTDPDIAEPSADKPSVAEEVVTLNEKTANWI